MIILWEICTYGYGDNSDPECVMSNDNLSVVPPLNLYRKGNSNENYRLYISDKTKCSLKCDFEARQQSSYIWRRCRIPDCDGEAPVFEPPWLRDVVPMQTKDGDIQPDGCRRYQGIQKLENGTCWASSNQTETCDSWVFGGDATSIQSEVSVSV